METDTKRLARFWEKVGDHSDTESCWLWTGALAGDVKHGRGYGVFSIGGRNISAHRFLWELVNNTKIPTGMFACHRCDTPSCVNPAHVFIGKPSDNSFDIVSKNRQAHGDRNGGRKLTWAAVRRARALHATKMISNAELSRVFNVSIGTIKRIVYRKGWNHDPHEIYRPRGTQSKRAS